MIKNTILYDSHIKLGAHMVDFAGYNMPLYYSTIEEEHNAVRNDLGIFDVSHMGRIIVSGKQSLAFINHIITNNITDSVIGDCTYSPMCYEDGGCVDDLLVYHLSDDKYMLVVNAANHKKDLALIIKHSEKFDVLIEDETFNMAQIALQGPASNQVIKNEYKEVDDIDYYKFKDNVTIFGIKTLLSRTGYTGEDGFEIYLNNDDASTLWNELIKAGAKPCGLGCRDTLRFEAGMPLYGNELSDKINPIEAGLSFFVDLEKDDFIGKDALAKYKANKKRKSVGFVLLDKGIARHGSKVIDKDGNEIGEVTTGYKSITFGRSLGFSLIESDYKEEHLYIQVRKKMLKAKIIKKRFLKTFVKEEI